MITQIDAKIYEALRDRIASMSGGIAVVYPGQAYPASPDVPFILVTDV